MIALGVYSVDVDLNLTMFMPGSLFGIFRDRNEPGFGFNIHILLKGIENLLDLTVAVFDLIHARMQSDEVVFHSLFERFESWVR